VAMILLLENQSIRHDAEIKPVKFSFVPKSVREYDWEKVLVLAVLKM
jgi:hypothetical protein